MGICKNGCGRDSAKGRRECRTCENNKYKQRNELMHMYHARKSNAKRRGIPFELTFENFVSLALNGGLMDVRGMEPDSMTIDRKDSLKGYVVGNVQTLTLKDNALKSRKEPKYGSKEKYKRKEEDPF